MTTHSQLNRNLILSTLLIFCVTQFTSCVGSEAGSTSTSTPTSGTGTSQQTSQQTSTTPSYNIEVVKAGLIDAVRVRVGSKTGDPNYEADFDFNSSGTITALDTTQMNAYFTPGRLSQAQHDVVAKKIMNAIRVRVGTKTGDANYIEALDLQRNGNISAGDIIIWGHLTKFNT